MKNRNLLLIGGIGGSVVILLCIGCLVVGVFGSLLSSTKKDTPRPVARATERVRRTATIPPVLTDTPIPIYTPTSTSTPLPTNTPSPTDTPSPTPTPTSTLIPPDTPVEEWPDDYKALLLQQALQSQGDVAVKDVKFDIVNSSRVVVITIETQGGTGEMDDETTLKEALAPFVVAYQSNQTLEAEIETVIVQAQGYTGYTRWFAAANIKHIGLLLDKKITTAEFVMNNVAFKVP